MPTYGYRCIACGHEFERVQKMTDAPVATCETCGSPVKKILYPVGISFKGSGFYVNDSRSDSGKTKKAEGETTAPADATSAPAPDKTETKTESVTPAAPEKKADAPVAASTT